MSVKIFFCYAHEDIAFLNLLKKYLQPLQREGLIWLWYDQNISAGTEWNKEINKHLNAAKIILLLVSPDFMNSDYCYSVELTRAIERHDKGEAHVIPIILRPIHWEGTPFSRLQAIPTNAIPVTDRKWHNRENAFYDVTRHIREKIKSIEKEAKDETDSIATREFSYAEIQAAQETISSNATEPLPFLDPPPSLDSSTTPTLFIKQRNGLWKVESINGASTLGRDKGNDIVLEDINVSRKHAIIYFNDTGECALEIISSSNGTIVNGKILKKGDNHILKEGDQIKLGQTELIFNSQRYT